jgi:hypothetical protein
VLNGNGVLAMLASGLLVFVSGGVIYLSTVEWRDRRRRRAQESGRPARNPSR